MAAVFAACTSENPVLGPESPPLLEPTGTGPCIKSCAAAAAAALVNEDKRFGTVIALSAGNTETIRREQLLHKQILREIRQDLYECRRACTDHEPGA